jgi:hypothetical protein
MSTIDLFKELGDIFKLQGEIIKMQTNETPIESEKLQAPKSQPDCHVSPIRCTRE